MHPGTPRLLLAFFLLGLVCACSRRQPETKSFEDNYRKAVENAKTDAGGNYAMQMGAYLQSASWFSPSISDCMAKNPDQPALHGYFEIRSSTDYEVVFQPNGAFANCISDAFEHHSLPAPPTTPYFNKFDFAVNK